MCAANMRRLCSDGDANERPGAFPDDFGKRGHGVTGEPWLQ